MKNIDLYNNVFVHVFSVEESSLDDNFSILNIDKWDSVAHMSLIAELEEAFDIMFDTDDIIQFSSYLLGRDLLKKYGVDL